MNSRKINIRYKDPAPTEQISFLLIIKYYDIMIFLRDTYIKLYKVRFFIIRKFDKINI